MVIVGGGSAGLSAALMLGRARRSVVVVDGGQPRNRFADQMHGVLGQEGVAPSELIERGRQEVAQYGVEVRQAQVTAVEADHDGVRVQLTGGVTIAAQALVLATGVTDVLREIPGLEQRWGATAFHCPYCHGWEVQDQRIGVLSTSALSLHQAELIRQWTDRVTVFADQLGPLTPEQASRLAARGIEVVTAPVVEIVGEAPGITAVRTADGVEHPIDAVITAPTPRPNDDLVAGLGLDRVDTPQGSFLAVDPAGRTSHERIWAVGNLVNPNANVTMSIGSAAQAAGMLNHVLVGWEFDRAVAQQSEAAQHANGEDGAWPEVAPADYWEDRYVNRTRDTGRMWSGNPNATLTAVVEGIPAGRSLDLGCGEGADVVWLAEHGWDATGIDISATALARAAQAARERSVPSDRIHFEVADLSTWQTDETFDLVTASFLHSPVALSRTEILRRAGDAVTPGGHLLVISHAAAPPWAEHHHDHRFLSAAEEHRELDLDPDQWEVRICENRVRGAQDPEGRPAELEDSVVLLRRKD